MYDVEWLDAALEELARLWSQADSALRDSLTAASLEIDKRLHRDASNDGESRSGGRRITLVPPLAATFRVNEESRTATVIEIVLLRPRSR